VLSETRASRPGDGRSPGFISDHERPRSPIGVRSADRPSPGGGVVLRSLHAEVAAATATSRASLVISTSIVRELQCAREAATV
jgi:hypothetical protein